MKPQALIIGAGPVGLTMAAELARYGVSVRIVDKAAQRTDKSKASVLWSRTLELLDRAGCTEAFIAAGHKVEGANFIGGNMSDRRDQFPGAYMSPVTIPCRGSCHVIVLRRARRSHRGSRSRSSKRFTRRPIADLGRAIRRISWTRTSTPSIQGFLSSHPVPLPHRVRIPP
jgi:2-polyprenyl-6-methoxyphenol hydroxylase-like FAD-dependent oxidoreductase